MATAEETSMQKHTALAAYKARLEAFNKKRERFQGLDDIFKPEDYPEAVCVLLELTRLHNGTGGAVRAAAVLLNAYNGTCFPCDPSDLGYLDPDLRTAALAVIWGRLNTGIEPHEFFEEGGKTFQALAEEYPPRFQKAPREPDAW
jgi:hypothetical protein